MLIGEAPIENSTTASKIAIQASAKKGGTSKHKNKSRQGRVKVEKKKWKGHRAQLRFIYVIIESQLNEQREEVDLVGTVPLTKLNTERISISNSKSMQ